MKRFYKGLTLAGLAALVFALGACDITALNDNPNEPSEATPPNLLTGVLHSGTLAARSGLAGTYWGGFTLGRFANLYAQYWTQNQYTDEDRYGYPSRRSGSLNNMWEEYYLALNDLQEIIRASEENPEAVAAFGPADNQIAIATILQAWTFQVMTDIWGPIPYGAALKGRTGGNFSPSYASQDSIYTALLSSLTAASDMIQTGAPTLASGDLIYSGDMGQWKKFANALKMRVAIRIADVQPDVASQAINEAIEAGAFTSNADNALVPFNESPPYQNPIYVNYSVDGRDDWAMTNSILGVMNANEDPRRAAYSTDVDGEYLGYTYGLPTGEAQARFAAGPFSRPGMVVREADAPAILMNYDEVLFIKAEAAQRGFISGDAAQFYRDAIRASMDYWDSEMNAASDISEGTDDAADISEEEIDAYLSRVPYDAANWQQVLGTQKWVALYMQGVQGWAEFRRLDFEGVLEPPPGNPGGEAFGQPIAVRLPYPQDENTLNADNLDAAVNNMLGGDGAGADDQGVKLWWDVN